MTNNELFHPVLQLPEPVREHRYQRLVGLDDIKTRLRKEAAALADPAELTRWARRHHPDADPARGALTLFGDRAPLLVFAGDVGCGKSALAESFGCDLAEHFSVPVMLYRLKLTARGTGHVGEMTTLIGEAFHTVGKEARLGRAPSGALKSVTVLVVDEADALVQSRDQVQMHHEDRAGSTRSWPVSTNSPAATSRCWSCCAPTASTPSTPHSSAAPQPSSNSLDPPTINAARCSPPQSQDSTSLRRHSRRLWRPPAPTPTAGPDSPSPT